MLQKNPDVDEHQDFLTELIEAEGATLLREKQQLKTPQGGFPEEAEALPAEREHPEAKINIKV
ncbi:hypothetical protein J2S74_001157 [Evansella vedderi]|uniref:Uncharacterized protein n=1 Tax=Evansella vedderi TaxID=38282 RepID=A0ABT9ZRC5_9BACI|nr:hypothetical protein [Evansella vedderi]MDQ0253785.1 hypothetical protein [Evansella vedderi]